MDLIKRLIIKVITPTVIALAVLFSNLGITSSASMAAPLASAGGAAVVGIVVTVLVSAGVITQDEANQMSGDTLMEMYCDFVQSDEAACMSILSTNAMGQVSNAIANKAVAEAIGIGNIIVDNSDYVKTVPATGDDVDMQGYGALIRFHCSVDPSASYASAYTEGYYCEYIVIRSVDYGLIYQTHGSNTLKLLGNLQTVPFGNNGGEFYDKYTVYGDIRNPDGTQHSLSTLDNMQLADIGEVVIDGETYPISGDGTVTVDGTNYVINPDGSVTVDGETYYPTYDPAKFTPCGIKDIVDKMVNAYKDKGVIADNSIDIPDVGDLALPESIADSAFAEMQMPKTIATVFPFCIPFDFVRGLDMLSASPTAPVFTIPFNIPSFGLYPGTTNDIKLDFKDYEKYFIIVRETLLVLYMITLCFISFKIVKGV